jgi:hypothetical protein
VHDPISPAPQPEHPDCTSWCNPIACIDDRAIREHRGFPSVVASALDFVRALITTTRADESLRGEVAIGTAGVELRLLSTDAEDPAEVDRDDVVLDARAAVSLAMALVDAATLVLVEQGGAR